MSEWIYDAAAGRCRKTDGEQAMSEDIIALARRHKHIATHYEGCEADHIGCLVNKLADEIEKLRAALIWYADPRNHFPVERRSPGDPDPAVVFIEEPPIMLDGGSVAREALEGKP